MESEGVSKPFCASCIHSEICMFKDEYLQSLDYYSDNVINKFIWDVNMNKLFSPYFSIKCKEYRSRSIYMTDM